MVAALINKRQMFQTEVHALKSSGTVACTPLFRETSYWKIDIDCFKAEFDSFFNKRCHFVFAQNANDYRILDTGTFWIPWKYRQKKIYDDIFEGDEYSM